MVPPSTPGDFSGVAAKKPSLTLNLGTTGLKVTSEPPPMAGQDRIGQRSPIEAAATVDVA
ncbi:hypothetical protein J6590_066364 [Homalodisca vitripennis]|nr:hypothetical protein J6590_066364 [Homalodisca vitripennis]